MQCYFFYVYKVCFCLVCDRVLRTEAAHWSASSRSCALISFQHKLRTYQLPAQAANLSASSTSCALISLQHKLCTYQLADKLCTDKLPTEAAHWYQASSKSMIIQPFWRKALSQCVKIDVQYYLCMLHLSSNRTYYIL